MMRMKKLMTSTQMVNKTDNYENDEITINENDENDENENNHNDKDYEFE